jgi:hypothetical protein
VQLRLLLPAFAWIILMTLILFRPYEIELGWEFGFLTQNHIVHFFLFLVCAHIWMGIFKKQLKFSILRQHSEFMVLFSGIVLAVVLEFIRFSFSFTESFSLLCLLIDGLGILAGIGIFRLVYRSCY